MDWYASLDSGEKSTPPPEKAGVVVDWRVRAGVVRGLIAAQSDCIFKYVYGY